MTILSAIRRLAQRVGVEVNWYNAEHSPLARIARLLSHCSIDIVVDVGANDGGYGRFLRQIGYQGRIISFEPLPDAYVRLQASARAEESWRVAPRMAIGEFDGEISINVSRNSVSSSILPMAEMHLCAAPQSEYRGQARVFIRRLDSVVAPFLEGASGIFLKVDTQGYEMRVLEGAEQMLRQTKGIQLELSIAALYDGQPDYLEVLMLLRKRGFDLWNVAPGFTDSRTGRMLQMDGIFVRRSSV